MAAYAMADGEGRETLHRHLLAAAGVGEWAGEGGGGDGVGERRDAAGRLISDDSATLKRWLGGFGIAT